MDIQTRSLSDLLVLEIVKAFGLPRWEGLGRLFRPAFHGATDRLAGYGLRFDRALARGAGMARAARELLAEFCQPVRARGASSLPASGPALIVSNHPGTIDGLVVLSEVGRSDVRLVSSRIPFIANLAHASRHCIFVTLDAHERMAGVRQAIRHLQGGGALLLFGSGHIDPDPAVHGRTQAADGLREWWPSAEVLLRRVPETRLVLSVVSHVVSPRWARHPITWLRRGEVNRRRLAELGQLVQQLLFPRRNLLSPCVSFSPAYSLEALRQGPDSAGLMPAILRRAEALLHDHAAAFDLA